MVSTTTNMNNFDPLYDAVFGHDEDMPSIDFEATIQAIKEQAERDQALAAEQPKVQPSTETDRAAYIHTTEFVVPEYVGLNINIDLGDKIKPRIISGWSRCFVGGKCHGKGRFNPNVTRISDEENTFKKCTSLKQFESNLTAWAERNGLQRDNVFTNRVDFTIDCYPDQDTDKFRKLCDALIYCFIAKHKSTKANQYRGYTAINDEAKNLKAKHGAFEIERYNKAIQDPTNGAEWRFELRDWRDLKQSRNTPEYIESLLNDISDELRSLPDYIDKALEMLNAEHISQFNKLQSEANENLSLNQFIKMREERFLFRSQADYFFRHYADNNRNVQKQIDNYVFRYKHKFISEAALQDFVKNLLKEIRKYLVYEVFYGKIKRQY